MACVIAPIAALAAGLEPLLVQIGFGPAELVAIAAAANCTAIVGASSYAEIDLEEVLFETAARSETIRIVATLGPGAADGAIDLAPERLSLRDAKPFGGCRSSAADRHAQYAKPTDFPRARRLTFGGARVRRQGRDRCGLAASVDPRPRLVRKPRHRTYRKPFVRRDADPIRTFPSRELARIARRHRSKSLRRSRSNPG